MREKITGYNFKVNWVEGKSHYIADALSRYPVFQAQEEEDLQIDTAVTCLRTTQQKNLRHITNAIDPEYKILTSAIRKEENLTNKILNTSWRAINGYINHLSLDTETGNEDEQLAMLDSTRTVSYTHLTLPTIYSV